MTEKRRRTKVALGPAQILRLRETVAILCGALALSAAAGPITAVEADLHRLQKWDNSNGDTWDPFWADDGHLYAFNCDGRGFGTQQRNLAFHQLTGATVESLAGSLVNDMPEYGKAGAMDATKAHWKVCGQECIDGTFYAFVALNRYGKDSRDPLMRQTSFDASLIKSTDRGRTWTRSAQENAARPMWPGSRFGAPCFIHYGQDGGRIARDSADTYVYALSNNGFWNGGDDFILGRVRRRDLPNLAAADWTYFTGGDGADPQRWDPDLARATPILSRPAKCGWSAPAFIPELNTYLLVSWYVTPTLKKWFEPGEVRYDFHQAPHPWGPWSFISTLSDRFLVGGHMYGPNVSARFQQRRGPHVEVSLFTSGCPFEDQPTGLYKMWRIPLLLRTTPPPESRIINNSDPAIRYAEWTHSPKRPYHDHEGDVHYTQIPGATAELDFRGTGIELLTEKYRDQGPVEILLDGQSRGLVDTHVGNFPRLAQVVVFRAEDLAPGAHRITVINRSTNYATLDAFRVLNPQALPP